MRNRARFTHRCHMYALKCTRSGAPATSFPPGWRDYEVRIRSITSDSVVVEGQGAMYHDRHVIRDTAGAEGFQRVARARAERTIPR